MEIQGGICTLCLEKCKNYNAIDGDTKNTLRVLLPKIDFTVIQEPVMCKNCKEMLIKYFDFKTMCLHTQECLIPFLNKEDNIKLDLKDVYLSQNVTGTSVPKDLNVCGFCMGLVKNCSAVPLDVEEGGILEKMMHQCLPELDLSIIKKPVICASCHGSLEDCFHFVTNCLIIGERIKKYCETYISKKGQIELSSLLELTLRDITTREVDSKLSDIIKIEEQFCEDRKNPDDREIDDGGYKVKLEQISFDDSEDVINDVENKDKNVMEMKQEINDEQFTQKNVYAWIEDSNKLAAIKIEEVICGENDDQKRLLNEEIEIKMDEHDCDRFEDSTVLSKSEVTNRLSRGEECSVSNFERDQSSKVAMYNCDTCSYQTVDKGNLKRHLPKCRGPSKVTMYNCDTCSYQTVRKSNFKRHLLIHKDPSEVTMYNCDTCSYQTKNKKNLTGHLLKHTDSSEVAIHKCETCSFQTIWKSQLKKHLLKHKDPSEVTMYTCDSCYFKTKYKEALTKHLLKHKQPSEVTMYNCDTCSYQTVDKGNFKSHLLKHKDPSEVPVYKCETCSFQTKWRNTIKKHVLAHKNPSEVIKYQCHDCLFQTIDKSKLKSHFRVHKDLSEVPIHKCETCSFQTKWKHIIKNHLLVHKNSSEVTKYKCQDCSFQTKHKYNLTKHLLVHKDLSEVTTYKCNSCSFQTKRKFVLKRHLLVHR